jgi:hypothetical protein
VGLEPPLLQPGVSGRERIKRPDRPYSSVARYSRGVLLRCSPCKPGDAATFQDRKYGRRMRAHTQTKQNGPEAARKWRCTVCRAER